MGCASLKVISFIEQDHLHEKISELIDMSIENTFMYSVWADDTTLSDWRKDKGHILTGCCPNPILITTLRF